MVKSTRRDTSIHLDFIIEPFISLILYYCLVSLKFLDLLYQTLHSRGYQVTKDRAREYGDQEVHDYAY